MLDGLKQYHIVWHEPSKDASESMPCGGHDLGLNVWVEQGEILFYIDRSGSFDENNQMLKLGRVRVRLEPNPFAPGGSFRQELNLSEGCIALSAKNGDCCAEVRLWLEVDRPVVHLDVDSCQPLQLHASYESWRTQDHPLSQDERMACLSFLLTRPENIPLTTYADTFLPEPDAFTWYHRNRSADLVFDKEVTQQHLDAVRDQLWNPQENLTFGGLMRGEGLVFSGTRAGTYLLTPYTAWDYRSTQPRQQQSLQLFFHTAQADSADTWLSDLHALAHETHPAADLLQHTRDWWAAFWERSYIFLRPENPNSTDPVWQVGRNYQLFRYLMGCNAAGSYPTKFNGGLWTVDPHLILERYTMATPDFRQWGGGSFTAQNQRLLYWPLLKSGDFDLFPAQFDFYRNALHNAEVRTQVYWGHGGASFTEQIENFGLPIGDIYQHRWGDGGLGPRQGGEPGWLDNAWCEDLYDTVLEFCLMILDTQRFQGADISAYLPLIQSCLTFFDQHYQFERQRRQGSPLDENGFLEIYPSTACETYKRALNPVSTVAGLTTLLTRLLQLPDTYLDAQQRDALRAFSQRIPPLSFQEIAGQRTLAPAKSWERRSNIEFPQLYPLFPYGVYGLGKPDLQVAIDTWRYGAEIPEQRLNLCWHQDPIFCARLGLTAEAAALTVERMADAPTRFPAFWGIGHDWTPDLDHPGAGAVALQEMLLQTDDRAIRLFPAWPAAWDVSFRLHAPYQTILEGELRGGTLLYLRITPAERQQDIVMMTPLKED
jgi:hypothetical protein